MIGLDRDENVKEVAEEMKEKYGERFEFSNSLFSQIKEKLKGRKIDGILFDLGLSSRQLDLAERGFSFRKSHSSPLLMTMGINNTNAFHIINTYSQQQLAKLIFEVFFFYFIIFILLFLFYFYFYLFLFIF